MINPDTRGPFVLVRFVGREFNYWNSCGFTTYKKKASKYCWSEAKMIKDRMNRSGDFPFKIAMVQAKAA
jgi:hypothetical protein